MDAWQSAQSWLLFLGLLGGVGCYYYTQHNGKKPQNSGLVKKRNETELRGRRASVQADQPRPAKQAKKPKPSANDQEKRSQAVETPTVVARSSADEEKEEFSARQFAEQLTQARKGADLSKPKGKENRVKTVKQNSALATRELSSGASQVGAEAGDDLAPAHPPELASDVSDMLEPAAKGPSTLRVTAPTRPQKQKVARAPKEEVVETKKQRQNRMKKEQQRIEREAEENARKRLEEKQRRAAREARGEPAKNGLGVSKAPTSNAWSAPKSPQQAAGAAPQTNGALNGPLLDTFDAESTASSNGGMGASTAATSTTEADTADKDTGHPSEQEQVAQALRESDDSGWTTVAVPSKKQKKAAPVQPTSGPKFTPAATTKPVMYGFSALNGHGDANDPDAWEA